MASQAPIIDLAPRAAAHVETEVVDNEVLLYHPGKTRAVYLNSTAAVVWGLCDGSRTVRDIIGIIGECYPEAGENLEREVIAAVNHLKESGVLVVD